MSPVKTPSLLYTRFSPTTHRIYRWAALAIAAIIAQQSLSVSGAEQTISHLDKVVHLLAYCLLGLIALPALPRLRPIIVIVLLGALGSVLEIGQGVMGLGRTADVWDALSNLGGAFMALVFWHIPTKLRA